MLFGPFADGKSIIDVLLVTENVLLGEVLERLMTCTGRIRVRRMTQPSHSSLIQAICSQRLDVFVIEKGLLTAEVLETVAERWQRIGRFRIVVINPDDNRVHIWDNLGTAIFRANDFVSLITNFSLS